MKMKRLDDDVNFDGKNVWVYWLSNWTDSAPTPKKKENQSYAPNRTLTSFLYKTTCDTWRRITFSPLHLRKEKKNDQWLAAVAEATPKADFTLRRERFESPPRGFGCSTRSEKLLVTNYRNDSWKYSLNNTLLVSQKCTKRHTYYSDGEGFFFFLTHFSFKICTGMWYVFSKESLHYQRLTKLLEHSHRFRGHF